MEEAATIGMAAVEDGTAAPGAETETTHGICERPACPYTVRDRLEAKRHGEPKPPGFPTAAAGAPAPGPMAAIGRHMGATEAVCPSEHDAIAARIRSLHGGDVIAACQTPVKHLSHCF